MLQFLVNHKATSLVKLSISLVLLLPILHLFGCFLTEANAVECSLLIYAKWPGSKGLKGMALGSVWAACVAPPSTWITESLEDFHILNDSKLWVRKQRLLESFPRIRPKKQSHYRPQWQSLMTLLSKGSRTGATLPDSIEALKNGILLCRW